jgi:hypothetical protein
MGDVYTQDEFAVVRLAIKQRHSIDRLKVGTGSGKSCQPHYHVRQMSG